MDWTQSVDPVFIIRLVVAAVGGLATGFFGGMVGLGGGRPRLLVVYWAAENPVDAAGTNLLVSALASTTGTWKHFREGRVDGRVLALIGIPSFVGAFIGGFFGGLTPRAPLLVVVGIITTFFGYGMLTGRLGGQLEGRDNPPSTAAEISSSAAGRTLVDLSVRQRLLEMSLGFGIGLFGGVVGLGAGGLRLPAMVQILGMDVRIAVGTNRAIGAMTQLFGFLGHVLHLEVDWAVVVILGPMAMLGSYLGASQTGRISPQMLGRWIGAVMVLTSLPIFWLAYTQL